MKKTLQAILKNRFQKNLAANFLPQKNKTSTKKEARIIPGLFQFDETIVQQIRNQVSLNQ